MLCIIDVYTRECLEIRVERKLNARDVLDELGDLFIRHGPPDHTHSDNGQECIAIALREWLALVRLDNVVLVRSTPDGSARTIIVFRNGHEVIVHKAAAEVVASIQGGPPTP